MKSFLCNEDNSSKTSPMIS